MIERVFNIDTICSVKSHSPASNSTRAARRCDPSATAVPPPSASTSVNSMMATKPISEEKR